MWILSKLSIFDLLQLSITFSFVFSAHYTSSWMIHWEPRLWISSILTGSYIIDMLVRYYFTSFLQRAGTTVYWLSDILQIVQLTCVLTIYTSRLFILLIREFISAHKLCLLKIKFILFPIWLLKIKSIPIRSSTSGIF